MACEILVGWCTALRSAIWEILLRSLRSWVPVTTISQWKSGMALMSWWDFFLTCLILNRKAFWIKRLQIVWKLEMRVLAEPTTTDSRLQLPDGERTVLLAPITSSTTSLGKWWITLFQWWVTQHTGFTGFVPLWVQLCPKHHYLREQLTDLNQECKAFGLWSWFHLFCSETVARPWHGSLK